MLGAGRSEKREAGGIRYCVAWRGGEDEEDKRKRGPEQGTRVFAGRFLANFSLPDLFAQVSCHRLGRHLDGCIKNGIGPACVLFSFAPLQRPCMMVCGGYNLSARLPGP